VDTIVSIKDLSFSYNKDIILENINLTINKKDFLAIIGPNGGGKSTLLKLILGLNKLQIGDIKILGDKPSINFSNIGYVPQNTNINTDFPIKVIDVVLMGHIQVQHNSHDKWWHKIFKIGYNQSEILCALGALKQVGMDKFANTKIGSLSGGQRQRVMIARSLCTHPKILLLDEPTASIDAQGQKQIYDLLKQLNKTITIIVVSHDISVILNYATKVAHINKTLTYHNIQNIKDINANKEHFCEVELLQMLNTNKKSCKC